MKKYLLFIPLLFIFLSLKADKLQASFDYCRFYSPNHGPYVETYLTFNGNSLTYTQNDKGSYQAEIEVILMFFKNGEKEASAFQKYIVNSPPVKDTSINKPIFIDQQRLALENGSYVFEIQLKDLNAPEEVFTAHQQLYINFTDETLQISDVQLYDSLYKSNAESRFAKNGYEFVPYLSTFYPVEVNKLGFYAEIYNTNKVLDSEEKYLLTYFIEDSESGNVVDNYKGFRKKIASSTDVIANSFHIKDLPSGNYNLVIEIRDKQNQLLQNKKLFFQRSNPLISSYSPEEKVGTFVEGFTDADTLGEHIRSLEPISERLEVEFAQNQLEGSSLDLMQQYFLNFWVKRDPEYPERAWNEYYKQVSKVNKNYGTRIQKGYLTDRGFRYLKYGPPNNIDTRHFEPGKYPYEIWHYYQLPGQSNRRFVFWSPNAVTNDFKLLHSDANGEIKNPQWRNQLVTGNASNPMNRETSPSQQFGSDTDFLFPR